jgi:hypothetical protein
MELNRLTTWPKKGGRVQLCTIQILTIKLHTKGRTHEI